MADAILHFNTTARHRRCAVVMTFAPSGDAPATKLGKRRAAVARKNLLARGFAEQDVVVQANADPSPYLRRDLTPDKLHDVVLLLPGEPAWCNELRAATP